MAGHDGAELQLQLGTKWKGTVRTSSAVGNDWGGSFVLGHFVLIAYISVVGLLYNYN